MEEEDEMEEEEEEFTWPTSRGSSLGGAKDRSAFGGA